MIINPKNIKVIIETTAPELVGSANPLGILPYKSIAFNNFIKILINVD